jgi:hypothetical protein
VTSALDRPFSMLGPLFADDKLNPPQEVRALLDRLSYMNVIKKEERLQQENPPEKK